MAEKNVNQIEAHYRGLEALQVDIATYSNFVVPLLIERLPEQVRLNMMRFGISDSQNCSTKHWINMRPPKLSSFEAIISHICLKH